MNAIPFTKMSGSGNDFILIDNRADIVSVNDIPQFVECVCRRKLSVGADGLILVERSDKVDFKWNFFNSDGSLAEMCGNGARCVARYAYLNGIAEESMSFETIAGIIQAQVLNDQVKIKMTDPSDLVIDADLGVDAQTMTLSNVNTGVPHVVIVVDDIESADVVAMGRQIRYHAAFSPAGTNVNFLGFQGNGIAQVRTYERGVEDETLACGTGIVASALVLAEKKRVPSPVTLQTRSSCHLNVYFAKTDDRYTDIYLEGDARIIYEGRLTSDAWQYE
jgi:diaminopimelate epimerase